MKQHKWAKEIKAWADGAEIEYNSYDIWDDWNEDIGWYEGYEYRIKPNPKPVQYLYVYMNKQTGNPVFELDKPNHIFEDDEHKYLGKIKLEDE